MKIPIPVFPIFFHIPYYFKNSFISFSLDSTLVLYILHFFFFSKIYISKRKSFVTYIPDPVPMSPLLATRNSCELVMSFSDCLTDWGVDWWRGRGCLCVALLLGNGRVDTVAGGWVCVLWASCEVLTALGGSGSLPITDPDPDAANKILLVVKHSSIRKWIFNVYLLNVIFERVLPFLWKS